MKTYPFFARSCREALIGVRPFGHIDYAISVALLCLSLLPTYAQSTPGYTTHEWGTFTSVQGGDGVPQVWRALESSQLPGFVYDWKHPGLRRQTTGQFAFGKGAIFSLQRMETPVLYFYADQEQTVDVSVKFPQGFITEWYPQAAQIGPAKMSPPASPNPMDSNSNSQEDKTSLEHAHPAVPESLAHWSNVKILPLAQNRQVLQNLPCDQSGSHYFSARETDANGLQVNTVDEKCSQLEREKFIFYRGVGNFETPLRVTMAGGTTVTLTNTGGEPLAHLFVLSVSQGKGSFSYIDQLMPGEPGRSVPVLSANPLLPLASLKTQLRARMAEALVKEGLYAREAAAMVQTWQDSWFSEDGVRVLYVLPRAWTDRVLPLTLGPAPKQLVRVMVGRAEILPPVLEAQLSAELTKASRGDDQAKRAAVAQLKKLGRFAEPALRLAVASSSPALTESAWGILQASTKPGDLF
jgi:hypothetical protein